MEKRQTILIVEDEEINRRILKKLLSKYYDVFEAENGEEAWKLISEKKDEISAVLLDIIMPVMDGHMLLKLIRDAHYDNIPIIVTTVSNDTKSEQTALDEGAWDYVSKPYNSAILLSRLRNAIARSQIAAYEKLRYVSEHDELTGFYNRRKLFLRTAELINDNEEHQFVFIRIDIDHFAMFNTSFGVDEGDKLLKYLASKIAISAQRYPNTVYGRISADIFCICAPYRGNNDRIYAAAEELQREFTLFRDDYRLEISVGVCVIDDPTVSIEEYYVRSSVAAQRCKNQIDTHLEFYDKSFGEAMAVENAITNEMQSALDERQFVVFLQPKFAIPSETACGAEALVRWKHPVKGMVSPGVFIPVFEKNGFVAKLDYYVWEETCRMLREWLDMGKSPFPISVNISRISLYNPQLSELLTGLVNKYGISPTLLQLEITESAYMTNPGLMEKTIDSLHSAGFTILMDDFGSGYSSLNTLKRIKVDVLKIDMKFLPVRDEVERGEIILSCIIKMAKWLGMEVIVEGVETRHQRDFLEGVGCDCIQGYYYSKPVPRSNYEGNYLDCTVIQSDRSEIVPQHNMTILIIDDSEIDAAVLYTCLCEMYHVHTVCDAEAGLAYLKQNKNRVRLILVDNQMDGMSGIEFLRHCNDDVDIKDIPKIMITASNNVDDQVNAFSAGAYDYITKPFVIEVVTARVKHVMDISSTNSVFDSLEQEYSRSTELDPATNLLNKIAFKSIGAAILETLSDDKEALMVIDIDDFKKINDQYGHIAGDSVISCIADVLSGSFRKTDVIGRFGGDEFVVMMTKLHSGGSAKRKAAEIIQEVIIQCMRKLNIDACISVGIAFSEHGDTIDTLFARADQALYQVKSTAKGRFAVYGEEVPQITDDMKPVVLVCSENAQLYPAIALAYGDSAAFANITSYRELINTFNRYSDRIKVVCLDIEKKIASDADKFYNYIIEQGGGKHILIIPVFRDGNMDQLKEAMKLDLFDVISMPPRNDILQRKLSRALMQ